MSDSSKKRGLSKFSDDAAKWRSFDQTVGQVRVALADVASDELNKLIDEAATNVREQMHRKRKRRAVE